MAPPPTLALTIGGLRFQLLAWPGLHETLARRYSTFSAPPGHPPDLTLEISNSIASPQQPNAPPCTFHGENVRFDLPGFQGGIDPVGRRATLQLSAPDPALAVDYFLRVACALLAYRAGGLLFHAAGVVHRGRAFLFFGPSGSGKTTVARNSPGAVILNDDLIILRPDSPGWRAHGTPFTNPSQIPPANASAPVAAFLRLSQSAEVRLEPLRPAQALAELLASAPILNASPQPPIERCQQLLAVIPAYRLHLRPEPSFWPVLEAIP